LFQHKHSSILILASIQIAGTDNKDRTQQNVIKMRELFDEMLLIDDTTQQLDCIWKSDMILLNQIKFGCYFDVSNFNKNKKNPFLKQHQYNHNKKKKKNKEADWKDHLLTICHFVQPKPLSHP
jgi:hypothetical protein